MLLLIQKLTSRHLDHIIAKREYDGFIDYLFYEKKIKIVWN
jgi:hypothetical protein